MKVIMNSFEQRVIKDFIKKKIVPKKYSKLFKKSFTKEKEKKGQKLFYYEFNLKDLIK